MNSSKHPEMANSFAIPDESEMRLKKIDRRSHDNG